jgi:hypothetical protein
MDIRRIVWGDMDWIYRVQGKDQWRAVVNRAMNFWVP